MLNLTSVIKLEKLKNCKMIPDEKFGSFKEILKFLTDVTELLAENE